MAIIRDYPSELYHSRTEVSKGDLDAFSRSPAHYKAKKQQPKKDTKALRVGRLIHTAILETHKLTEEYAINPGFDKRSKEGKAAYLEWESTNEGKTIVSAEEMDQALAMQYAAKTHPVLRRYIISGNAERELSVFVQNYGVQCRSRLDYYHPYLDNGSSVILDLKTTENASYEAFRRDLIQYRYHVQAAFYSDNATLAGLQINKFIFAAIEKKHPYAIALYELDPLTLSLGRETYRAELSRLAECIEKDEWPSYPHHVQTLQAPPWALKQQSA